MALTRVHTDLIEGSLGGDASEELQVDTFVGDGTTVTFGLTRLPDHANNTQVYISGVYQQKDTYTVSGLDLTFSEAPAIGESIEAVVAYVNPMYSGDHVKKVQAYNPNILINPSFTVKQRGDVVEHINSDSFFGPDRWGIRGLSGAGGTKVESSTEVEDVTGINKLVVKHEGTTTGNVYTVQSIEAVNLQGLYSKEMTFSLGYSDLSGSGIPYVQISSYDSLANVKLLYDAIPTSLGDNRWTCTFTLSTTDGTIPDPSESGMLVGIYPNSDNDGNVGNAPNEWRVWETKLEAGSVVTPFIARSHGEELALCERYFEIQDTGGQTFPLGRASGDPVGAPKGGITFRTVKRATPTVTFSLPSSGASLLPPDLSAGFGNTFGVELTSSTAIGAGDIAWLRYKANIDSEL